MACIDTGEVHERTPKFQALGRLKAGKMNRTEEEYGSRDGQSCAGGKFAKQASQWMTHNVPNLGRSISAELVESKRGGAGNLNTAISGHSAS